MNEQDIDVTVAAPARARLGILLALNRTGRHVYGGTVPEHVINKRRTRNRVARRSRRINRKG